MSGKWFEYLFSGEERTRTVQFIGSPEIAGVAEARVEEPGMDDVQTARIAPEPVSRPEPAPAPAAATHGFGAAADVYSSVGISIPARSSSIVRIGEMLRSSRIRDLSPEAKRSAVLLALEAIGGNIEEALEDAVHRMRALAEAEMRQQMALDELELRKAQQNREIQTEMDRIVEQHRARIRSNKNEIVREKARICEWGLKKKQEEQRLMEVVSYFAGEYSQVSDKDRDPSGLD